jgi:hypothetical protein
VHSTGITRVVGSSQHAQAMKILPTLTAAATSAMNDLVAKMKVHGVGFVCIAL